jgi:hypothetical protein
MPAGPGRTACGLNFAVFVAISVCRKPHAINRF